MEILSISMDKNSLVQLEQIQKRLGYSSRSKMLRNAVLSLIKDYEALDSLKGNVESVFVLVYKDTEKNNVSDLIHKFREAIETDMHHHHPGTGIDILTLNTTAEKTREFFNLVKRNKCIYSVNYSVISKCK